MTKPSKQDKLSTIVERLRRFTAERDWSQFHNPKNLAMAIASEAGELLAELRWVASEYADEHTTHLGNRERIEHEVADIAIALLLFCDRAGIDLLSAIEAKIDLNAERYPVSLSRGNAECPSAAKSDVGGLRIAAVDWSGEAAGGRQTIWLAEIVDGELVRLENGRSRAEITDELITMARANCKLVVGLDFAFGFPEWFLSDRGVADGREMWRHVEQHGEQWLGDCVAPFWGRPGKTRPATDGHFRKTELALAETTRSQPKSVFQIGGAGAVGTGSIRGMPALSHLRAAGFSIWPFDAPALPLAVEIYPRLLTGPVVKSNAEARREYLAARCPMVNEPMQLRAAQTEDAFDAAVSALVMWEHRADLLGLTPSADPISRREGSIWAPAMFQQ